MNILINYSNHPSEYWSKEQKDAAAKNYGTVIDVPFPSVPSAAGSEEVNNLTEFYFRELQVLIKALNAESSTVVHLMGEFTFSFALLCKLKNSGVKVIASTSERVTSINSDGSKQSYFKFIRFREYA